jgi:GNAT superfamily N-acetyltransferase
MLENKHPSQAMFFYTSNKIIHENITFQRLSEMHNAEACLAQVAEWIEHKWGYLRNNPGIEYRIGILRKDMNCIYIAAYAGIPIGMYALKDLDPPVADHKELWFVYVDESFRHLGVGSYIMDDVKNRCVGLGVNRITFDTLMPTLNKFYKRKNAFERGEGRLLGAPVTLMQIDIEAPSPRAARTAAAR